MYLGMTEEDYQYVQKETPKLVAKRLGIAADLPSDELDKAIADKDATAFGILNEFRTIYEKWWNLSKVFSPERKPEELDEIKKLINSRNEMRSSLVSYLNAMYGKPHESR